MMMRGKVLNTVYIQLFRQSAWNHTRLCVSLDVFGVSQLFGGHDFNARQHLCDLS